MKHNCIKGGLTKGTVTDYINLNVAENLSKYILINLVAMLI